MGGESDSEETFEKTSGFGSGKPSEVSELCPAELLRAREDSECLATVRQEAQKLERTVERLIADTEGFLHEAGLQAGGGAGDGGVGGRDTLASFLGPGVPDEGEEGPKEPRLLGAISAKMKAFRKELQAFLEQVARVGDGLSPLPHLTESSSFLSTVTSVSRDSPIGNLGKELGPDLQVRGLPASPPPCHALPFLLLAGIAALLGLAVLTAAWL